MYRSTLITSLLAILTAASTYGQNPTKEVFKDFSLLELPRADVRIGAMWMNGIGPIGDGAPEDNVIVQKSYDNLTFDKDRDFKLKLDGILSNWLSLGADRKKDVTYKFDKLEIVSAKDPMSLDTMLDLEKKYIYQGIRIKDMSIITEKSMALDITGKLKLKIDTLTGSIDYDGGKTIKISGLDIYMGIKIVAFDPVKGEKNWQVLTTWEPSDEYCIWNEYTLKINWEEYENYLKKEDPKFYNEMWQFGEVDFMGQMVGRVMGKYGRRVNPYTCEEEKKSFKIDQHMIDPRASSKKFTDQGGSIKFSISKENLIQGKDYVLSEYQFPPKTDTTVIVSSRLTSDGMIIDKMTVYSSFDFVRTVKGKKSAPRGLRLTGNIEMRRDLIKFKIDQHDSLNW